MPSLDSLRGAAILLVLVFHAFGSFKWEAVMSRPVGLCLDQLVGEGNFGVQLFFMLSGFLIGGILLRARSQPDYYKNFYIARVLRIFPVYLLVLILLKVWHPVSWNFILAALLFMANFAKLFGAPLSEYGPLWSLAVEEHFYLLWPTCVRCMRPRHLVSLLVAVIVAEPVLRTVGIHLNSNLDIRFKTPFVLDYIAYGALIATLVHMQRIHRGNARKFGFAMTAVGLPLTLFTMWLAGTHATNTLVALQTLPWMWLCVGLLLLSLDHDSRRKPQTFPHRQPGILPFFGYISYGLYLINVFTNKKIDHLVDAYIRPGTEASIAVVTAKAILSIGIATAVAYLSRRFFEEPILQLKHRLLHRPKPATQGIAPQVAGDVASVS